MDCQIDQYWFRSLGVVIFSSESGLACEGLAATMASSSFAVLATFFCRQEQDQRFRSSSICTAAAIG
jgi:membrane-associated PAP2 superfamily phosphatase